jgi:hypothetical protein
MQTPIMDTVIPRPPRTAEELYKEAQEKKLIKILGRPEPVQKVS